MWRVMICDDEPEVCASIRAGLDRFSAETGASFQIQECHSGESLLCRMTPDIDLLFLDIKMKELTGMEAAREIRKQNQSVCIVFVTSMVQYAIEGYQVHAYGFLRKPVRYGQFRLQMMDVVHHLNRKRQDSVTLKVGSEVHTLALDRVLYLEVCDHELRVVQADGALLCHVSMGDIERLLEGKGFFRCHKSYLVNLRHVVRVTPAGVELSDHGEIPVSKHRRKAFLEAFASYMGGFSP